MRIIFYHDLPHAKEVDYAFKILSSFIDCELSTGENIQIYGEADEIVVSYGYRIPSKIHTNHLHIFADPSYWDNFHKPESLPTAPIRRFSLQDLQLRSNDRVEDPLICPYYRAGQGERSVRWEKCDAQNGAVLVCDIDLIASTFFWITCYEEMFLEVRDEYGRVPEDRLLCVREKCFSRPLVDEYGETLFQLLSQFGIPVQSTQESFRVLITHDVDSGIPVKGGIEFFEYGLRSLYRETFRERRFRAGLSDCFHWFAVGQRIRSCAYAFNKIVKLDQTYGYTSHFFIMANGTHPKDSQSNIFSEYSRRVINEIKTTGGQIGLHLGINSHNSCSQFRTEWNNIREVVSDVLSASRNHYLVSNLPHTWKILAEIGSRVDSTLGFSKYMGFRAGTSRPFRPFDILNRCVIPLWEYPMIIMDKHLFVMRVLSDRDRIKRALEVVDIVVAHRGCLVINWHNMYFFSDYLRMYKEILAYLAKRGKDVRLEAAPELDDKLIW